MTVSPEKIAALIERLTPRHIADEPLARAVVSNSHYERRQAVSAYLVDNNALKSEAVAMLTTLRSQLSGITEETSRWQPIETAPKAGQIVVWCPTMFNGGVYLAKWDDDRYAKNPRPYWSLSDEVIYGKLRVRECQPTHWKPLPSPPLGAHP